MGTMLVYHGTRTGKAVDTAVRELESGRGLWVTDSPERATRYANARATGIVSQEYAPLAAHGVVIAIEVDEEPRWTRRPVAHASLDTCEAFIHAGRVVIVQTQECDYWNCTCHPEVRARQD